MLIYLVWEEREWFSAAILSASIKLEALSELNKSYRKIKI